MAGLEGDGLAARRPDLDRRFARLLGCLRPGLAAEGTTTRRPPSPRLGQRPPLPQLDKLTAWDVFIASEPGSWVTTDPAVFVDVSMLSADTRVC